MIRLCGAALGFLSFSVTIFLGMAAGNTAEVTIRRAIGAMIVFCAIGLCTGWVASRVLDEHAKARKRELFPENPEAEAPPRPPEEDGAQAAG